MIDTAAKPPTGPSDETIKKVKTLYVLAPPACAFAAAELTSRQCAMQREEGEPEALGHQEERLAKKS